MLSRACRGNSKRSRGIYIFCLLYSLEKQSSVFRTSTSANCRLAVVERQPAPSRKQLLTCYLTNYYSVKVWCGKSLKRRSVVLWESKWYRFSSVLSRAWTWPVGLPLFDHNKRLGHLIACLDLKYSSPELYCLETLHIYTNQDYLLF